MMIRASTPPPMYIRSLLSFASSKYPLGWKLGPALSDAESRWCRPGSTPLKFAGA